jgi:hypothetical protein
VESLHFESINEITPKYEAFPTSTLDFEHDSACENIARTSQHVQKLKRGGDMGGN